MRSNRKALDEQEQKEIKEQTHNYPKQNTRKVTELRGIRVRPVVM